MNTSDKPTDASARHGEYKIPEGKLVVVDLQVVEGCLSNVQLSGDFFLEPPETLEAMNAALNGLPHDVTQAQLEQAINAVIGSDVMMFGITAAGVAVVVQRALA
ncbi:biotin--protein ligase [Pusillimonas sp. ANT_WB101]|uniref:biotin--protein ligase n=1 Tax=Pusillimonas sp. ANT_WB101 TaxID=2597356 RepID=UPI0011EE3BA7|nr:biotin--protein ligase [Pusillimonas sp. ANT_WB101]KAA0892907.1 biotin--protein ligase [Pusillimonas sp. ANT_WB101]